MGCAVLSEESPSFPLFRIRRAVRVLLTNSMSLSSRGTLFHIVCPGVLIRPADVSLILDPAMLGSMSDDLMDGHGRCKSPHHPISILCSILLSMHHSQLEE